MSPTAFISTVGTSAIHRPPNRGNSRVPSVGSVQRVGGARGEAPMSAKGLLEFSFGEGDPRETDAAPRRPVTDRNSLTVEVHEGNVDAALKLLRKHCVRSGLFRELRLRETFPTTRSRRLERRNRARKRRQRDARRRREEPV